MTELGTLRWTEIDAAPAPILAIPVGSCEQHGPHLPLATDTVIAIALARRLAAATEHVLVAPALSITASGEHGEFPGTLSIGTATTTAVIVELVRSADWAAGAVLVNGHGGNADAVRAATEILSGERRRVLAWWPHIAGGDAHAGDTETSMMLALDPESVRLDEAEPGTTAPITSIAGRLRSEGVRAVSPSGVLGDPRGATAARGRELLDVLAADLVAAVGAWRER